MPFAHVLRALWRRKLLLIAIPASISLIFGLVLYNLPRAYHAQVHYAFKLDAPALQKMFDRFYSGENQRKLLSAFQKAGLDRAIKIMNTVESRDDLAEFLALEATPNYIDYAQKQNMKLSFERTWAENIEKLEQLTAEFLTLKIRNIPKTEMEAAIPIVRHNLEYQLPLYDLRDQWLASRIEAQTKLAQFTARKRSLQLDLQRSENILKSLKMIEVPDAAESSFRYQLNIDPNDEQGRFLPLALRIQSFESAVIQIREQLEDDGRRAIQQEGYDQLLEAMLDQLEPQITGDGDLQAMENGLQSLRNQQQSPESQEFLEAHLRNVQKHKLSRQPITQAAAVIPLAKGTIAKTLFVFVLLGMICVMAVAIEDYTQRQSVE